MINRLLFVAKYIDCCVLYCKGMKNMKKREWVAGKPKKKPDYDSDQITEEVLSAAVAVYRPVEGKYPSLQNIANELSKQGIKGLNPLKVRKLLITAGVYKSPAAAEVLRC